MATKESGEVLPAVVEFICQLIYCVDLTVVFIDIVFDLTEIIRQQFAGVLAGGVFGEEKEQTDQEGMSKHCTALFL